MGWFSTPAVPSGDEAKAASNRARAADADSSAERSAVTSVTLARCPLTIPKSRIGVVVTCTQLTCPSGVRKRIVVAYAAPADAHSAHSVRTRPRSSGWSAVIQPSFSDCSMVSPLNSSHWSLAVSSPPAASSCTMPTGASRTSAWSASAAFASSCVRTATVVSSMRFVSASVCNAPPRCRSSSRSLRAAIQVNAEPRTVMLKTRTATAKGASNQPLRWADKHSQPRAKGPKMKNGMAGRSNFPALPPSLDNPASPADGC
jgi:hypothetical protein